MPGAFPEAKRAQKMCLRERYIVVLSRITLQGLKHRSEEPQGMLSFLPEI